jgi:rare lipoprotein A
MQRVFFLLFAGLLLLAAACAGTGTTRPGSETVAEPLRTAPATTSPTMSPAQPAYRETGTASWYGEGLQGRRTASGELFDMNAMTAAHRTLPLGTIIRVTNLDTFKSITLKVNDRGPFERSRVLAVSFAAARELGFASRGTAPVRIETVEPASALAVDGVFWVQAAVYSEEENARLLKDRLSRKYEVITIIPCETNVAKFYRVMVGAYGSEEKAERIAGKLVLEGLEPLVLRKD